MFSKNTEENQHAGKKLYEVKKDCCLIIMNLSKNEKPKSTRERERKREKERERERKREKERERERKRESKAKQTTHHQSQQKQPIAQNSNHSLSCSRCLLKIPTNSTYYYNSKKPDNYKFCSQECYQE